MTEHQLTEQQLIQLAQQEEQGLMNKRQTLIKITEALKETSGAIEALKEIKTQKGNYLVNLGAGIYIESEINTKKCTKNYGENGYIEEPIEKTIEMLEKRKEAIEKQGNKLNKEIIQTEQKLTQMISILKQIEHEKRKNFSKATKQ